MTFEEKIDNFTNFLHNEEKRQGLVFIEENGDGRDKDTGTMLLEDVWGWIAPIGTDPNNIKKDENFVCAEREEIGDNEFIIRFVKHE